jgi:hypothetical protein
VQLGHAGPNRHLRDVSTPEAMNFEAKEWAEPLQRVCNLGIKVHKRARDGQGLSLRMQFSCPELLKRFSLNYILGGRAGRCANLTSGNIG